MRLPIPKALAAAVAAAVTPQIQATEKRIIDTIMQNQNQLDTAIGNVNTAVQKLGTDLQTAIAALTAKAAGSGIDFTPEINQLNSIATAAENFDASVNAANPNTAAAIVITGIGPTASVSGAAQQGSAVVNDGAGDAIDPQPEVAWGGSFPSGGNVSATGLYTPGTTAGTDTITASDGNVTESVTVVVS